MFTAFGCLRQHGLLLCFGYIAKAMMQFILSADKRYTVTQLTDYP